MLNFDMIVQVFEVSATNRALLLAAKMDNFHVYLHICVLLEAPFASLDLTRDVGLFVHPLNVIREIVFCPGKATGGAGEQRVRGVGGAELKDQLLYYCSSSHGVLCSRSTSFSLHWLCTVLR